MKTLFVTILTEVMIANNGEGKQQEYTIDRHQELINKVLVNCADSQQLQDLLLKMLSFNPNERPT